jgi:hypothetical protein
MKLKHWKERKKNLKYGRGEKSCSKTGKIKIGEEGRSEKANDLLPDIGK